jgi:hypothetical protein
MKINRVRTSMPAPDQEAVLKALTDFIALGRNVGLPQVVHGLESFESVFRTTKPTLKVLQGTVKSLLDSGYIAIRERVLNRTLDYPRPGMRRYAEELDRAFRALDDLIYPPIHPNVPHAEIVGLAGNKDRTSVLGDPKDAKMIAKQSLDVVKRFSKAVFNQDVETAYALCANELKSWMSVKRFVTELQKADARFGGPAVELVVERITWIYADEASRKRSNSDGDWPKDTPKPNKRALVGGFWFNDKKKKRGRSAFFWVTEEAEGYCIAKFDQYIQ